MVVFLLRCNGNYYIKISHHHGNIGDEKNIGFKKIYRFVKLLGAPPNAAHFPLTSLLIP